MAISAEQVLDAVRGKSIRAMRHFCFETSRSLMPKDAFELATRLFPDPDPHGAMAATLFAGHVSYIVPEALGFLREQCSLHPDIRVQDCLARSFDHYCLNRGYERAWNVMLEWAKDSRENVRRAVIEAPRPWGKKDYFSANPKLITDFLGALKADESGTVRFSVGRALAEAGEDFPDQVMAELKVWNLKNPMVKHTYMFAAKNLLGKMGGMIPGTDQPQT